MPLAALKVMAKALPLAAGVELFKAIPGWGQAIIFAAAVVTAGGVLLKRVIRPCTRWVRRTVGHLVGIVDLLGGLNDRLEKHENAIRVLTDFIKDEHQEDMRTLVRRGVIPQPPLPEEHEHDDPW